MASGLVSYVQLSSTELALKAIQTQQAATAQDTSSTLPDIRQVVDSVPADTKRADSVPMATPRLSIATEPVLAGQIATADFMTMLKAELTEIYGYLPTATQGKAMLQALASGTLKVFDPVEGIVIEAWDVATDGTLQKQGDGISAVGWSQFLKQHVRRDNGAAYTKDKNGSYVDLISGESAYFGAVGSKYYYFTWP